MADDYARREAIRAPGTIGAASGSLLAGCIGTRGSTDTRTAAGSPPAGRGCGSADSLGTEPASGRTVRRFSDAVADPMRESRTVVDDYQQRLNQEFNDLTVESPADHVIGLEDSLDPTAVFRP